MRNGQKERLPHIVRNIIRRDKWRPLDFLVLVEVFLPSAVSYLQKHLALFPHVAYLPRSTWSVVSGGVMVLSKQPLTSHFTHYPQASGTDRLAAKGILYVVINHEHVFCTHMQAWDDRIREMQWKTLQHYIEQQGISNYIICGDLNYNLLNPEHRQKLHPYHIPQVSPRNLAATKNARNSLRGLDGTADETGGMQAYYCSICYSKEPGLCRRICPVSDETTTPHCDTCSNVMVDYALFSHPRQATMQTLFWKSVKPLNFKVWRLGWITTPMLQTHDLSDHFPVEVRFQSSVNEMEEKRK
jgi:hypothetical protein